MTEAEAIVWMLSSLGRASPEAEEQSPSAAEGHPSAEARTASFLLKINTKKILSKGWYFNRQKITVSFDARGKGHLSKDSPRALDILESPVPVRLDGVGKTLWVEEKPRTPEILVVMSVDVPFETIPPLCQNYIVAKAALDLQGRLGGTDMVQRLLLQEVDMSYAQLMVREMGESGYTLLSGMRLR